MSKQIKFGNPETQYILSKILESRGINQGSTEDVSPNQVAKEVLDERLANQSPSGKPFKRGVLTGAFDPYHGDHGTAIMRAAELCDQLVIALSTDEVIRGYKHHEPFFPYKFREKTIAQIKGVSLVIPQENLYDKLEMLEALGADVLFSCEEYQRSFYPNPSEMTNKQIAGVERWERFEEEANSVGIDVVYLPRGEEMSSTRFKERALELALGDVNIIPVAPTESFYTPTETSLIQDQPAEQ